MIKRILVFLFLACIAAAAIIWLSNGGIGRVKTIGKGFTNPLSLIFGTSTFAGGSGGLFTLPGQDAITPDTPGIDFGPTGDNTQQIDTSDQSAQQRLDELKQQYEDLKAKADARSSTHYSPY